MLIVGSGLMVMTKFCGVPVQPPRLGVTLMFPVVTTPTLAALKAMFPVPLAPKPMAVLLFVQAKVAPEVPVNVVATGLPAQAPTATGRSTIGAAMTVMVKFWLAPMQPLATGVTVTVPTPMAAAVKLIFPAPLAASPMAVLSFTQLNVGLLVPVKLTATMVPEQTV